MNLLAIEYLFPGEMARMLSDPGFYVIIAMCLLIAVLWKKAGEK